MKRLSEWIFLIINNEEFVKPTVNKLYCIINQKFVTISKIINKFINDTHNTSLTMHIKIKILTRNIKFIIKMYFYRFPS